MRTYDPAVAPAVPRRRSVRMPVLRVLPGTPESAGLARALAREMLGDSHPALETVLLVVSELVTNAIIHSLSGADGGTEAGDRGSIEHGGPWRPLELVKPGPEAEHGYGLVLVDALADSWGTLASTQGRVTWCRISATQETKV